MKLSYKEPQWDFLQFDSGDIIGESNESGDDGSVELPKIDL